MLEFKKRTTLDKNFVLQKKKKKFEGKKITTPQLERLNT